MNILQGTTTVRAIAARRRTTGGWVSPLFAVVLVTLQLWTPSFTLALPTDGNVVAGEATIQQATPKTLNIQQATDKVILNWHSFSIAADEAVRFSQPSISSIALNRVTGIDPSVILGSLQANGRIFLINPNGILFGSGAQINVGGLLATTLQTRDDDFMAGRYLFAQDPLKGLRSVVNKGEIRVSDQGFVYLVAPGVANDGVILANLSSVLLGSAQKVTIDLMGDGLINYALSDKVASQVLGSDGKPLTSAVSNSGTIQADGGYVLLSARASGDIFESVINQNGIVRAKSLVNHGGVIRLEGGDPVQNTGTIGWQANLGKVQNAEGAVLNTGTINVSAAEPGAAQGEVTITGQRVGVSGTILARGADGAQGGRVLISSTDNTVATSDSVIDSSGIGLSTAGNVVIWSDMNTLFGGTILARGGALGGNGGQIEVSGHDNLGFLGRVNALAPNGLAGSLLLDPRSITVATGGAATLAQVDQFSDTPGTNRTIDPATINAAAANVTLQANRDITVTNAIAMSNNGVGINMQAGRDIFVNNSISTTNGNISMTANDSTSLVAHRGSNANGNITFAAGANLSSGTGNISLTIDPAAARNFAPGSITTVRNLTTTTGNISFNSPNAVSLSGAVNAGSGTVTINTNTAAGSNNFTMNAGSSITTTNTTAGAVQINVNTAGGGTGTAALQNITTGNGGTITVATNTGGNATGGDITQTAATLLDVDTGTVNLSTSNAAGANIGSAGANVLTRAGTISASSGSNGIFINNQTGVDLASINTTGAFALTTNGPITQSGALAVTGTTTLAAGAANNITLNNAGNDFSTVAITNGNNVALTDANALVLGASTVSGTLGVTTAGALTQSGVLNVTGASTLAAGAANNIDLATSANDFSTVAIISGNNVSLRDVNALVLGASTVNGTLALTTGGALTQSGALNVTGATSFTATAANTDILLGTQANNFGGALSFAGTLGNFRDVSIRNVNAGATVPAVAGLSSLRNLALQFDNAPITLPALTLTAGGNLNVTAGGTISQSGVLTVPGTMTLVTTVAGSDILLNSQANNLTWAITFAGTQSNIRDVGLRNVNAGATIPALASLTNLRNLTLQFDSAPIALPTLTLTAGGNLNVTAGGSITETGAITVPGTTTLATTVAGSDILLHTQANNFGGAVSFGGTQSNIRDVGLRNVNAGATVPALAGLTSLSNLTLTFDNAPVALPSLTLTAGGNLNVTAGGSITETGTVTVPGATTLATTVAGSDILLDTQANNFGGALAFGGAQTNIRDVGLRNVNAGATAPALARLTNLRNLALTFDAAPMVLPSLTASGNLTATAGGLISQSGALNVAGAASFDTIAVATLGSVTLANGGALTLNTSTVGGNLTVSTAAGDLTLSAGQTLTVVGDATLSPAGTVNLLGTTRIGGTQSSVGSTGSTFVLGADTNLNALALPAAGDITVNLTGITASFAGAPPLPQAITLGNAGNSFGGPVSVTTAAPAFTGTTANTYNLTQSAPVNLNVGQGLTVTDLGGTAGTRGNITLTNAGNIFNTVTFTGGNIAWAETGPVTIGAVSANPGTTSTGALAITSTGAITQTGAIVAASITTLTAGANDITLTNAANNFSTVGITSGNIVSLVDSNALGLGASTVSGNFTVTSGGSLTQSGALTVTGTTNLASTEANSDILLDTQANNFGGAVAFGGTQTNIRDIGLRNLKAGATMSALVGVTNLRNLTLTFDNAPIALPSLTASGNLSATAGGTITQIGALTIAGITTLAAGINDITLTNGANNFSTVGITSGDNVSLVDNTALGLGASTVTGNLNVTTGGALTQSGALTVAGTTTLVAGANDITLNNTGNNFSTVGVTSGNNVTLTDANALTITASTVSGNFSANASDLTVGGPVASTGGNLDLTGANTVTQLANLTAAGANTITVTTAGGPITMAATATTISGTGGINYTAGTDMTLGSLSTGGGVNVIANGGSVLSAAGSGTNLTAGANSTLQAFNGVVGTRATPINVAVNPGTLGIRATSAIGGISGFVTGTVLPGNTLTLLNVPPGLVCFNICPVTSSPVSGLARSTFGYLNPNTIIPAHYPQPYRSVLISDITSVYMPGTLLQPSPVSLSSGSPAVQ